jgi:hypothetical protein
MKYLTRSISWIALAVTALTPVLFFLEAISLEEVKQIMLVAAFAWFIATPFWMEHKTRD